MNIFCFAEYIKILKKHCGNKKIANERIIGDLMTDVCYACGTVNKAGDEYFNSKELASKLINRKEDLPVAFRETLLNNSLKTINEGLIKNGFFKKDINPNELNHLIATLDDLYSRDLNITKESKAYILNQKFTAYEKISYFLVECAKINNKIMNEKVEVFSFGLNKVNYVYDDIINLSFAVKKNKTDKIVVVPVDVDFNMHLSKLGDDIFIVSENTIHGKWLKALHKKGITEEQILSDLKFKRRQYLIGDIGEYKYQKTLFYLLACSKFDKNYVAHANKEDIKKAIVSLLTYYNNFGQRYELYVPLIGTTSSRAKLSNRESFQLILSIIKENEQLLNGTINIVIYINDRTDMEDYLNELQNENIPCC